MSTRAEKSQPTFTDSEFCNRLDYQIDCTPYNGSNPILPGSYGATVKQLSGSGFGEQNPTQLTAVGEPSLFTYKGQKCMSFVFAERLDTDAHMNLDIAWICE